MELIVHSRQSNSAKSTRRPSQTLNHEPVPGLSLIDSYLYRDRRLQPKKGERVTSRGCSGMTLMSGWRGGRCLVGPAVGRRAGPRGLWGPLLGRRTLGGRNWRLVAKGVAWRVPNGTPKAALFTWLFEGSISRERFSSAKTFLSSSSSSRFDVSSASLISRCGDCGRGREAEAPEAIAGAVRKPGGTGTLETYAVNVNNES